jgi:hypothetical protein
MFITSILCVALAQVPAGPSEVSETTRATPSQASEQRNADSQRLIERRKKRRPRATADWRRGRADDRRAAERPAPVIVVQPQPDAAWMHYQAQQALRFPMRYPYGYPWYPYPGWRPSGPILLGPYPEPMPRVGPLPGGPSGRIPLGPFPQPMPQPAPLPVNPLFP